MPNERRSDSARLVNTVTARTVRSSPLASAAARKHVLSPGGVNRRVGNPEVAHRCDGTAHLRWYVVKLEIEKHRTQRCDVANQVGTARAERGQTDLLRACKGCGVRDFQTATGISEVKRDAQGVVVQCQDSRAPFRPRV